MPIQPESAQHARSACSRGAAGCCARGRSQDFEVTTTAQRDERVLCASSRMFAASLRADPGPRFELSHAAIEIVDAENDMVDVNARTLLHGEQPSPLDSAVLNRIDVDVFTWPLRDSNLTRPDSERL